MAESKIKTKTEIQSKTATNTNKIHSENKIEFNQLCVCRDTEQWPKWYVLSEHDLNEPLLSLFQFNSERVLPKYQKCG